MTRPGEIDEIGFDPDTETYHAQFSINDADSIWLSVVHTVAVATGKDPKSMAPLYSVLDPDALQNLLAASQAHDLQVSFTYEERAVTIASNGDISVKSTD